MAREEEFQWTLEQLRDLTRERLANLRIVGVEPCIWEYEDGQWTFRYIFHHGCVRCHDFTKDGDMCWCVLGRPIVDTRWHAV